MAPVPSKLAVKSNQMAPTGPPQNKAAVNRSRNSLSTNRL